MRADGTFEAHDMPSLFYVPDRFPARLESGHGTWSLERGEGRQYVDLTFTFIEKWNGGLPFGNVLFVSGNTLYYFADSDSDSGRMIWFERKP